jgi:Ca2+-binding RTX toxin-like protein
LTTTIDGDKFSNGGDILNFTVNRDVSQMVVSDGTRYGNSDGYQVDFVSFAPTTSASGYTYPVEIGAVLQDTDASEGFVTVQLSGFAAGSTLSFLNATTGQLTTIAASGATQDGTAVFNIDQSLLSNAFVTGSFADQIYVTTPTQLATGFAPNMTVVTQDGGGSQATSFLGGSGSNSYTAGTGNDYLSGGEGNDTLSGGTGSDIVSGGAGTDTLAGGAGSDTLTGGTGADTFAWSFADRGTLVVPARDVITDFNTASYASGGDRLDLRDILQGTATSASALDNYLDFSKVGSDTVINVRPTGISGDVTQQIVLQGVDLTNSGALTTDQAIIQDLLTKGKLQTD